MGSVEVGVDDHHVCLPGPFPGRFRKALVARRAPGRPRAVPGSDADLGPGVEARFERQIGAVAGLRRGRPRGQALHLPGEGAERHLAVTAGQLVVVALVSAGQLVIEGQLVTAAADLGDPLPADVVGATLEHGEIDRVAEGGRHHRQVVLGQLVLEGLGGGRHHTTGSRSQGGDQVGQALSGAGPGGHDQVVAASDGVGHRRRHALLGGAVLVMGESGRDPLECGQDGAAVCRRRRFAHPLTLPPGRDVGDYFRSEPLQQPRPR